MAKSNLKKKSIPPRPPKGNQYALGNNGGRPRTVSLSPDKMIELGKEMVEWVIKNDPLQIFQWYSHVKHFTYKQFDVMKDAPEFSPYYEQAQNYIALKYINGESKQIKQGISERFLRVYFKDMKKEENELITYKIEAEILAKEKAAQQSVIPPTQTLISNEDLQIRLQDAERKLAERDRIIQELSYKPHSEC